jgi:hypothetical protein
MPTSRILKTKARGKPKPNLDRRGQHRFLSDSVPVSPAAKQRHQWPHMCVQQPMAASG